MKKEKEAHHCQQQAFRPVPQENLSFVEQAPLSATGFPACSTRKLIFCGTGILPVPKNLIEKGAISQMQPETLSNVSKL
ncbi:hypothetical protein QUA00_02050 [Microcoleus sp. T2B6]